MQMNSTPNLMQINLEVSGDIFENLNEKIIASSKLEVWVSWEMDEGETILEFQKWSARDRQPQDPKETLLLKKDKILQLIVLGQTMNGFLPSMGESQYLQIFFK